MPTKKRVKARRPKRLNKVALKAREAAIIADLRAGNLSYRKIAARHKVSLPTVNAKARKAGIRRPRGRRPMVAAPVKAVTVAPRRRAKAAKMVAPMAKVAHRPRKRGRPRRVAARAIRVPAASGAFQEAFRQMVLHYYPRLTLAQFDRLAKVIAKAVS